jgi:GNAT superfamily N-acetyltransferase
MEYVHHDAVCGRHWPALIEHFADFQPLLCDGRGRLVAGGYTIPVVDPRLQGRGLSRVVIRAMGTLARRHGLRDLIAPVCPTLKHRYPLTPMADYVRWRRPDRAPFDPWLRVHWRLGARIVQVAPRSWSSTAASASGSAGRACGSGRAGATSCPAR